jgi:thimet oligopeptidase
LKRKIIFVLILGVIAAAAFACSKGKEAASPKQENVKFTLNKLDRPILYESAKDAKSNCDYNLGLVKEFRGNILSVDGVRNVENTLEPMNEIHIAFERILGVTSLMANTHPDADVRKAAEECKKEASAALTEINMDKGLYSAIKAVDTSKLDGAAKRFVMLTLREYERAGVDKDDATRRRLAELDAAMVQSGLDFGRNIRDSKPKLKVTVADLEGLPADFIAAKQSDADGYLELSTDYTDYFPVLSYAKSEAVRRDLTQLFNERAYPANEAVLKKYLEQRYEFAQLLGFPSWAAYITADKMAKNPETVASFIDEVVKVAKPRMEIDVKEQLERKKKEDPSASEFYSWDRFYYNEKLKQEKYQVNAQEIREYFAYEKVKKGLLATASQVFGVSFQQVDAPVWHDAVEAYNVIENDKVIAYFYLDMHPRDGKYGHAASFGMLNGIEGLQLPAATLVCNFPQPSADNAAYMEHKDVVTFFHEFGHLMHQLLAGRHRWANQSGISCEWDFVETPSQLFEEWAWDYDVLKHFATNDEGKIIDAQVVKRMKQADSVGLGVHVMRQMYFAALSFQFHNAKPADIHLQDLAKALHDKYSPFAYINDDHSYTSFGHLDGYSAIYYTYMWSLAIAKDFLERFKSKGLLDPSVSREYRNKVLAVGGAKDADEMVKDFLGRPYELAAFKKWLSE